MAMARGIGLLTEGPSTAGWRATMMALAVAVGLIAGWALVVLVV